MSDDTSPPREDAGETAGGPERRRTERRKGGDRRSGRDRRSGMDRRSGVDRRRSPGRRKSDLEISEHRKVERRINEYPMTDEELEFIRAVNDYKQQYNKPFPTWSEILHILKSMGYRKA